MTCEIRSFQVLGVTVHLTHMSKVLDVMDGWIALKKGCHYIVATGMHGAMVARKQPYFMRILNSAGLFVPDGYSLVALARLKGLSPEGRISGPDLMWASCEHAEKMGHRIFFYGDTEDTLRSLSDKLSTTFPELNIVGYYSPPFRTLTHEEDAEVVEIINATKPDILWVGLGLPKQEVWIYEHIDRLDVSVAIGVGAAFKFLSGRVRRAPKWIGNNGFEWLWRFIFEPKRVWRRVLIDGPHFIFLIAKEGLDSKGTANTK